MHSSHDPNFFTTCPSICPTLTRNMKRVQEKFLQDMDVMILSHTVYPEHDSPSVLNAYADLYDIVSDKWHLLTGDKRKIYEMARKGHFAVKGDSSDDLDAFIHTENFVLVDKKSRIRGFYNGTNPHDVNRMIEDILLLKQETAIFKLLALLITIINAQNDMTVLFQYFDDSIDIYVDEDEIVISADGIPSHLSPYFPETYNDSENGLYYFEDLNSDGINDWYINPHNGMNVNPNQIGLQDYEFRIPLNPVINPDGPTDTFLGEIGVSLNGVPLYNEYEDPVDQLDPQTILSFDLSQGQPAPGGLYHYHFPPESLFVSTEDNFIGFAADGFPVYGPKNMDGYNVDNLDDYHAEFGPTPDFPDSVYHYHTNYTSPYIIGAFAGAIGTGFGPGDGGGGDDIVDCEDVPPGAPCCGDGICGGPETDDNCPDDLRFRQCWAISCEFFYLCRYDKYKPRISYY